MLDIKMKSRMKKDDLLILSQQMIKRLNNLLQRLPVQVPVYQMKDINSLLEDCEKLYTVLENKTGLDVFLAEKRFEEQFQLEKSQEPEESDD